MTTQLFEKEGWIVGLWVKSIKKEKYDGILEKTEKEQGKWKAEYLSVEVTHFNQHSTKFSTNLCDVFFPNTF